MLRAIALSGWLGVTVLVGGSRALTPPDVLSPAHGEPSTERTASLHTAEGEIDIELYPKVSPLAVARFCDNATRGVYDGTVIHNVNREYPTVYGGLYYPDGSTPDAFPGNPPPSEAQTSPRHERGTVGIVTYDVDYQSHEFYIGLVPLTAFDGQCTVIGTVTAGLDVLDRIVESAPEGAIVPGTTLVIDSITVQYGGYDEGD